MKQILPAVRRLVVNSPPPAVLLIAVALATSLTTSSGCAFSWGDGGISDVSVAGRKPGELGPQQEPKAPEGSKATADAVAVEEEGRSLRKIAILPVAYSDASGGIACDLCPSDLSIKPTSALAARLVTGFTYEAIARHPRLLFPPPEVVEKSLASAPGRSMRATVMSLSAAGKADLVVVAALVELRPRIGSDEDPERPAGVAIYASLINAKDGAVLWSDTFDRDESSRNFALRAYDKVMNDKPIRWSTAEGYAEQAVDELIEDLVDEID